MKLLFDIFNSDYPGRQTGEGALDPSIPDFDSLVIASVLGKFEISFKEKLMKRIFTDVLTVKLFEYFVKLQYEIITKQ